MALAEKFELSNTWFLRQAAIGTGKIVGGQTARIFFGGQATKRARDPKRKQCVNPALGRGMSTTRPECC
jgi:hypothetical protein